MRLLVPLAIVATFLPNALAFSGKTCRIMPLGASITYGDESSQKNGYRDDLYLALERDGNTVDMVGNNPAPPDSTFKDKDTEGWTGFIIDRVAEKMRISMPRNHPNIATVLVGTNDMTGNVDPAGAPARLGKLIDDLLDFPPLTMVVVSSLPPNSNTTDNSRINTYNAAIPGVVEQRADAKGWVIFADCGKVVGLGDLADGTHPNDVGYQHIGKCFYDGIVEGERRGWLAPVMGPPP
ncbi:FG-GAP repeat domain-containing protein [Coprinellus micaceus]|uniref:FG-GAP repeat domain-containing protein n=1 Tax=Coprinellus micaceus TaxID=71717 RepID=A0A4Y7TA37_COPMI|nr:FG-GAP repeat domain-containing protein [Coprinellus micaceus]